MMNIKPEHLTESERLHAHIRKRLTGQPDWRIAMAIAHADSIHIGGIGHMQTALDAAIAVATTVTQPQQVAA